MCRKGQFAILNWVLSVTSLKEWDLRRYLKRERESAGDNLSNEGAVRAKAVQGRWMQSARRRVGGDKQEMGPQPMGPHKPFQGPLLLL